jgi:hypothetical protein
MCWSVSLLKTWVVMKPDGVKSRCTIESELAGSNHDVQVCLTFKSASLASVPHVQVCLTCLT